MRRWEEARPLVGGCGLALSALAYAVTRPLAIISDSQPSPHSGRGVGRVNLRALPYCLVSLLECWAYDLGYPVHRLGRGGDRPGLDPSPKTHGLP